MKDFLKYTLATVTGLVLTGVVFFIFGIVALLGMTFSEPAATQVTPHSVMMLQLKGSLTERSQEDPLAFLLGDTYQGYGLNDVLAAIRKAKEHPDIEGIYIQAGYLNAGFASLEEIRNALLDFKESGKSIVTYADTYTQGLYYLSSVADKVLLNPKGMIEWKGLAASPVFYKELLEKVGVEMQVFKVGTYKSAVEPYIATEMSDANREQVSMYIHSIWQHMVKQVAEARQQTPQRLNEAADEMLMFQPAEKCLTYGLADALVYKDEVEDLLKQQCGLNEDDEVNYLSLEAMKHLQNAQPKDKSGQIVAVYYASGQIVDYAVESPLTAGNEPMIVANKVIADLKKLQKNDDVKAVVLRINSPGGSAYASESPLTAGNEPMIVANKVIADLKKLQKNDDVKAVVLRINSPGGSAYASEQIWHAVSQLKREKPVIVSMGDYAASGGYYMACNADTIVAQPTTLTGSIGIYGMFPNTQKLTEKLGVHFDGVKTNRYADFGSFGRGLNEGEKGLMQRYVNEGYDLFLTRCANGRLMTKEAVDKVAQGRVWTGADALERGLVDVLGGLDTAIGIAARKAQVESYTLQAFPKQSGFLEALLEMSPTVYLQRMYLGGQAAELYSTLQQINHWDCYDPIQAIVPYDLSIH